MKKNIIKVLVMAALSLLYVNQALAETVSLSPASQSAQKNSNFSLTLNINSAVNLFGVAFNLNFNPALMSFVSATEGNFLANSCSTALIAEETPAGTLAFGLTRLGAACGGVSGSGSIATLNFNAKNQDSTANLTFSDNALCVLNGTICDYITGTWNGATATIGTPTGTLPPTPPPGPSSDTTPPVAPTGFTVN